MTARALCLAVLLAALAGCGGGGVASTGSPRLVVSAAASLKKPFSAYGAGFDGATVRLQFAGSDELAAQIRKGVRPDVYAAANTTLPRQLFAEGLVEPPRVFAGNRLVLAVPHDATSIASLRDLARPGTKLAIGAKDVPVGAYTRTVLDRLPAAERAAILANVRTEEPDVAGIVGKLSQRAVDAGFVYLSDVRASEHALRAIALPAALQPAVAYGAAVVKGSEHPAQARRFVDGLLHGRGQAALRAAGFEPPPAR